LVTFRPYDGDKSLIEFPNREEPPFKRIRAWKLNRRATIKNLSSVVEVDAMLDEVDLAFVFVPFEFQSTAF